MSAVKSGRERARLERDLAERRAELSEMKSPEAAALRAEIEQALAKPAGNELELVRRADFLIEAEARSWLRRSEDVPCWKGSQASVTRSRREWRRRGSRVAGSFSERPPIPDMESSYRVGRNRKALILPRPTKPTFIA